MSVFPVLAFLYCLLAYEAEAGAKAKLSNIVLGVFAFAFILMCISRSIPWLVNCGEIGLSFVCVIKGLERSVYPARSIMKSRGTRLCVIVIGILTTSLPLLEEMKSRGVFGQANEDRLGLCCVGGKHGTGTSCGDVVMTDLCEKIKTACDCMYGEGTFEKAQVEQTETDFAHCFRISLPGGTNFIINAMKKDGTMFSFVESNHPRDVQGEK